MTTDQVGTEFTVSLIDGDIIAYRCAATCWDRKLNKPSEPLKIAIYRMEDMINGICTNNLSDIYRIFLSDSKTFRHKLSVSYKANRKDIPRPPFLDACKNYLAQHFHAEVEDGLEADDLLGITQCQINNGVICSIDKDLLQIPGNHLNFVTWKRQYISPQEGLRNFFKQLLIGDSSDNIFGVRGIGKVGASKLLDHMDSEEEMLDCVRTLYKDDQRLLLNCNLLWVLRRHGKPFTKEHRKLIKKVGLHEAAKRKGKRKKPTEMGTRLNPEDMPGTDQG